MNYMAHNLHLQFLLWQGNWHLQFFLWQGWYKILWIIVPFREKNPPCTNCFNWKITGNILCSAIFMLACSLILLNLVLIRIIWISTICTFQKFNYTKHQYFHYLFGHYWQNNRATIILLIKGANVITRSHY